MESRSWCSPAWDTIGHGSCDLYSQTLCYFDTTGQSISNSLQHADYDSPDCQAVSGEFTPSLQSVHEISYGEETVPLEGVQWIPNGAPITAQQPNEIFPGLITSECSLMYHSHSQRTSQDPRTSKEDDEIPERRREQNRKSQRAFRKRREDYIRNLNDQFSRLTKQYQTLFEANSRQADSVQNLKLQIAVLNARLESLRRQRDSSSSSPPRSEMLDGFLLEGGEYAGGEASVDFVDFATSDCSDFVPQSC